MMCSAVHERGGQGCASDGAKVMRFVEKNTREYDVVRAYRIGDEACEVGERASAMNASGKSAAQRAGGALSRAGAGSAPDALG